MFALEDDSSTNVVSKRKLACGRFVNKCVLININHSLATRKINNNHRKCSFFRPLIIQDWSSMDRVSRACSTGALYVSCIMISKHICTLNEVVFIPLE